MINSYLPVEPSPDFQILILIVNIQYIFKFTRIVYVTQII